MTPYWVEQNDLLTKKGDETRLLSVWEHARYVEVYRAEEVKPLVEKVEHLIRLLSGQDEHE